MKQILITVLALAVGGAGGFFLAQPTAAPAPDAKPSLRQKETKKPDARDVTIAQLRKDVKNLRDDLAALKDKLAKAKAAAAEKIAVAKPLLPHGTNVVSISGVSDEEAAKLRPKVMSLLTNAFATASTKRRNAMQTKLDILASVDAAKLTPAQRKTHARYQDLLAKQAKLREKFMSTISGALAGGSSSAKMDGESMMEMMKVDKEVRTLAEEERANLLTQMVQTMGYTGDTATEMTDTIGAIYTATEATKGGGLGSLGDALGNLGGAAGGASDGDVKAETQVITIGM